jgi:hypothetical protein
MHYATSVDDIHHSRAEIWQEVFDLGGIASRMTSPTWAVTPFWQSACEPNNGSPDITLGSVTR